MNRLRFSSWLLLSLASAWAYAAQEPSPEQLLLKDFRPRSIYKVPVTSMAKARFPVIDMHSHDYAKTDEQIAEWVRTMDELGIRKTVILSGAHGKAFDAVLARYRKFPGRFSVWCGFDYTGYDQPGYGPAAVAELERCFKAGAEGVGEEGDKGRGLFYSKPPAWGMHLDDPRLDALLESCGQLGMPISIHVADPMWMYEPMDRHNDGLMNAQDRLVYGTDMGRGKPMYLTTFRILETEDEHFYDWDLFTYHWPLNGFGLNDRILKKVYSENAQKILERRIGIKP